ncbi:enoyl-CoA hydratase [soil metagenome]
MAELVVLTWSGPVATLRLANPPLNLVTTDLIGDLDEALAKLEAADHLRAVVLTGTGERAFCAGSDVKEFEALQGRVGEGKLLREKAVYRRLAKLPVPTIAAVQADALGGGLELAMCCDLRVAAESARLGLPEVRLGVMPGSGGTQRLPRLVGLGRAKEMILLGQIVGAAEAAEIGLVNRVTADGGALDAAISMAETISERGPVAVREAKRCIDLAMEVPLDEGLAAELDASERIFASDDLLEGSRAFFGKRPPDFQGR